MTLVSPDYTQEQIINQIDFVTQDSVSRSIGEFYWFFGKDWFIETHLGNFHWEDKRFTFKENKLHPYLVSLDDFCHEFNLPYPKSKGVDFVFNKCGSDFILTDLNEKF